MQLFQPGTRRQDGGRSTVRSASQRNCGSFHRQRQPNRPRKNPVLSLFFGSHEEFESFGEKGLEMTKNLVETSSLVTPLGLTLVFAPFPKVR